MGILSTAGKDAGLEAAKELHATVDDALPQLKQTIGEATDRIGTQLKDTEDHGINGLFGILAAIRNTLNGAELPVDVTITVRVQGKVGALKLSAPIIEEGVIPSATVTG